ncbi:Crp/Fnr family transcriptional regulator [Pseudoduganella sp. FT25W]|uniref:Crp/Fnr family transcriptional regulator n=2 Tax=Duganella alba TaxID=2666081 RepID=A0A6L5QGL9_9BURK|nr:Crp/Fnr family transcriptional regulator [Duganella alba]MRX18850.1 Crp/Fnr family transcriptional regulator [Duganella alba]
MKRIDVSEESYNHVTNLLATIAKPFHVRKGEYLQRAGVPATQVHWLASGVARSGFFNRDGVEMTLRFYREGESATTLTDLISGESGQPAVQFLIAETPIHGFTLDWKQASDLRAQNEVMQSYHLNIAMAGLQSLAQRAYSNGETSAQERLAAFREEYPGLEARISQRAIASYLGITPQYMSRLRREAEAGLENPADDQPEAREA